MNYGQGFNLPTIEAYYPELSRSTAPYDSYNTSTFTTQCSYNPVHRCAENMSDGHQSYTPRRGVSTSATAYRAMARQKKQIKEIFSRNGLHSPMDAKRYMKAGDGQSCYPCFGNSCDFNSSNASKDRNSYW